MNNNDFEEFARQLIMLSEVFGGGKPVTSDKVDIYFQALSDLTVEQIKQAVVVICRTKTISVLPLPAEIREACEGNVQDRAAIAYETFTVGKSKTGPYRSVIFQDKTIHAVVIAMGGWEAMCLITEDDWRFRRKEFVDLYRAIASNPRSGIPEKLAGIIERTNSANGFDERIPDPVYITSSGISQIPLLRKPNSEIQAIEHKDDIG